ncbi:hypothetical protein EYF80_003497 [Liparis tanakae]|uniref:Uncharacterized protein n=1 Tax=Liparis tanakae TaxID=230148 RepID=A0A4Z2J7L9_9TELE|nr:hypothetical protein EYF80_003497 [Liparis tanakae]
MRSQMKRSHRQTGRPALHAVLLTALVGSHGLVGRRSAGLGAKGILGEFLMTGTGSRSNVNNRSPKPRTVTTHRLFATYSNTTDLRFEYFLRGMLPVLARRLHRVALLGVGSSGAALRLARVRRLLLLLAGVRGGAMLTIVALALLAVATGPLLSIS